MSRFCGRLDGEAAVDAAVELFSKKVLADDGIKHFFKDVDMQRQARHQILLLTDAFGGIPNYPGAGDASGARTSR